jgi:hypothetical protein
MKTGNNKSPASNNMWAIIYYKHPKSRPQKYPQSLNLELDRNASCFDLKEYVAIEPILKQGSSADGSFGLTTTYEGRRKDSAYWETKAEKVQDAAAAATDGATGEKKKS